MFVPFNLFLTIICRVSLLVVDSDFVAFRFCRQTFQIVLSAFRLLTFGVPVALFGTGLFVEIH